jgi:hypothetical protein
MSRTWAYLSTSESQLYRDKAESLGISEGELTQKLIQLFLNTHNNSLQPDSCLQCQYYQIATSNVMKVLASANSFFSLVQPEWERNKHAIQRP